MIDEPGPPPPPTEQPTHNHVAPSPWQLDQRSEPPLYDPYAFAPAQPPPGLSGLALASVFLSFIGPVGSILAIVFGLHARREIEQSGGRRTGHALATIGIALGVCLTMVYGAGLSYFVWTDRHRADPAGAEPAAEAPLPVPSAPTARAAPSTPAPAPADLGPFAPKHTKVKKQGEITVVDVGSSTSALPEELAKQRAEASSAGETLVVMTTASRCDPCRGVDRSLVDEKMQTALAKIRLVRVDIMVFHDDLETLKIPDQAIPGFFLLAPDLTPRDGVDGGEWDDDIPPNIAPVLGPFVRGKYAQRRRPWKPVPPSGISL